MTSSSCYTVSVLVGVPAVKALLQQIQLQHISLHSSLVYLLSFALCLFYSLHIIILFIIYVIPYISGIVLPYISGIQLRRPLTLSGYIGSITIRHLGNLCSHISASFTNGVWEVANKSVVTIERYCEEEL